jgi:hypothetical protein
MVLSEDNLDESVYFERLESMTRTISQNDPSPLNLEIEECKKIGES